MVCSLLLGVACGGGAPEDPMTLPRTLTVTVDGVARRLDTVRVSPGTPLALTAHALDDQGADVDATFTWSCEGNMGGVVFTPSSGASTMVSATTSGGCTVTVSAQAADARGSLVFLIDSTEGVASIDVVGLTMQQQLEPGVMLDFTIVAHDARGVVLDVDLAITFVDLDESVATIAAKSGVQNGFTLTTIADGRTTFRVSATARLRPEAPIEVGPYIVDVGAPAVFIAEATNAGNVCPAPVIAPNTRLIPGDTLRVYATYRPCRPAQQYFASWVSDDPSVATTSAGMSESGEILAVGPGTTTIRARGAGAEQSFEVTVEGLADGRLVIAPLGGCNDLDPITLPIGRTATVATFHKSATACVPVRPHTGFWSEMGQVELFSSTVTPSQQTAVIRGGGNPTSGTIELVHDSLRGPNVRKAQLTVNITAAGGVPFFPVGNRLEGTWHGTHSFLLEWDRASGPSHPIEYRVTLAAPGVAPVVLLAPFMPPNVRASVSVTVPEVRADWQLRVVGRDPNGLEATLGPAALEFKAQNGSGILTSDGGGYALDGSPTGFLGVIDDGTAPTGTLISAPRTDASGQRTVAIIAHDGVSHVGQRGGPLGFTPLTTRPISATHPGCPADSEAQLTALAAGVARPNGGPPNTFRVFYVTAEPTLMCGRGALFVIAPGATTGTEIERDIESLALGGTQDAWLGYIAGGILHARPSDLSAPAHAISTGAIHGALYGNRRGFYVVDSSGGVRRFDPDAAAPSAGDPITIIGAPAGPSIVSTQQGYGLGSVEHLIVPLADGRVAALERTAPDTLTVSLVNLPTADLPTGSATPFVGSRGIAR